jgi:mitochondrial fission protein ELM1
VVDDAPGERRLPDRSPLEIRPRGRSRWLASFEAASARHPNVRWRLALWTCDSRGRRKLRIREGGRALEGTARVWVIHDGSPENAQQALGLAESLGWPFQVKRVKSTALPRSGDRLWPPQLGLDPEWSEGEVSWPDLVIASGRSGSRAARWVGRRSLGRTRVVELGSGRERSADPFDIVVAPGCSDVPPDRLRIETTGPLAGVTGQQSTGDPADPEPRLHGASHPRVALLVGRREHGAESTRRMAGEVARSAQAAGGTAFAVTSPRTRHRMARALARGLGDPLAVRRWKLPTSELCDADHLAAADALVVPGTSEALLVQAVATDKPVYIYRLPRQGVSPRQRFARWVHARARARPLNRRGTVRPQQGLEYLCARLVERGFVRPSRDPEELCEALIRRGVAKPFGAPLDATDRTPFREAEQVAARIRSLLGSPVAPRAHTAH